MDIANKVIWIIIGLVIYFLPTIQAKGKQSIGKVFVVNWIIGWTIIGWVLTLIWVRKGNKPAGVTERTGGGTTLLCSDCGKYSPPGSKFCSNCGTPLVVSQEPSAAEAVPTARQPSTLEWIKRITILQWIVILVALSMFLFLIDPDNPSNRAFSPSGVRMGMFQSNFLPRIACPT